MSSDNTYPEAAHIVSAQRWAHGLPLYSDYRQAPYLVTAFPPVWYALLAIPARLGLDNLDALTIFGRLLNLVSLLAVCGIAHLWNRRLGLPSGFLCFAGIVSFVSGPHSLGRYSPAGFLIPGLRFTCHLFGSAPAGVMARMLERVMGGHGLSHSAQRCRSSNRDRSMAAVIEEMASRRPVLPDVGRYRWRNAIRFSAIHGRDAFTQPVRREIRTSCAYLRSR